MNNGYTTGRAYDTEEEAKDAIRKIIELDDNEQLSLYFAVEREE